MLIAKDGLGNLRSPSSNKILKSLTISRNFLVDNHGSIVGFLGLKLLFGGTLESESQVIGFGLLLVPVPGGDEDGLDSPADGTKGGIVNIGVRLSEQLCVSVHDSGICLEKVIRRDRKETKKGIAVAAKEVSNSRMRGVRVNTMSNMKQRDCAVKRLAEVMLESLNKGFVLELGAGNNFSLQIHLQVCDEFRRVRLELGKLGKLLGLLHALEREVDTGRNGYVVLVILHPLGHQKLVMDAVGKEQILLPTGEEEAGDTFVERLDVTLNERLRNPKRITSDNSAGRGNRFVNSCTLVMGAGRTR